MLFPIEVLAVLVTEVFAVFVVLLENKWLRVGCWSDDGGGERLLGLWWFSLLFLKIGVSLTFIEVLSSSIPFDF